MSTTTSRETVAPRDVDCGACGEIIRAGMTCRTSYVRADRLPSRNSPTPKLPLRLIAWHTHDCLKAKDDAVDAANEARAAKALLAFLADPSMTQAQLLDVLTAKASQP